LKIEDNVESIIANIEIADRLSFNERLFATKLNALKTNLVEETVLNRLKEEVREQVANADDFYLNAMPQMQVCY
jgi:hypothetical protein